MIGGSAKRTTLAAAFEAFGSPDRVLRVKSVPLDAFTQKSVLARFIASPINPADINQIQGTYPSKPKFTDGWAIGGNEGLAEIMQVGSEVKGLRPGDWVLPATAGFGTWRQLCVADEYDFMKINPTGVSALAAATAAVNPCTALRMLSDFKKLLPGDVILQNGANSGVGQAVIQIARARGIKTVNVVRDRPNLNILSNELKSLGADMVITEEALRSPKIGKEIADMAGLNSPVQLALNCVGGKNATNLVRLLGKSGIMVTYGGMSKEPTALPTGLLIFNDIQLRGFWMTRWNAEHTREERASMMSEIFNLIRTGQLKEAWNEVTPLSVDGEGNEEDPAVLERVQQRVMAAVNASTGGMGKKQILVGSAADAQRVFA